ncbi:MULTISPECIES: hypothetical protein [unclassified Marinomonas]|jgi:hypothetical protein|uniref:Toxin-antitoxin system antitoxin subunit n=1 Tax=Marinomonas sp. (strain MWYL1) TaxID=400668 RepID=A6VTH2_MARMS|nr:hypothetical protein [Marinomonas sp. A3A]MBU2240039.1 hypothetical protein [Gammaproteobacteria bacterium]QUX90629.1 hypothetical protein CYL31_04080 [Marinomonas sp. A3A]
MNKDVFQGIVDICQTHAERLHWSMQHLADKQPYTAASLSELTEIELAVFDQFIVRFSKLQDVMGAKLFPAVIELTYEEGELTTFIDKLNRLEKIGALGSVEQWLKLREMRNQFAHDYPDDPEIQSALLNKAFGMAGQLLQCLDHVVCFAAKYQ